MAPFVRLARWLTPDPPFVPRSRRLTFDDGRRDVTPS